MNTNDSRTLWISVGVGLMAILLLYSWSQDQKTQVSQKLGSTKHVVRAAEDISEMETIDESKLEDADIPAQFVQPGAIEKQDVAIGQVAAAPIKKGEQILLNKVLTPGPETGLSIEISPGKRGITIPIDDMRGVSHLLKPGDRIDLVAALETGKGVDAHREIRTILQDVTILATGLNIVNNLPRRFEVDSEGKKITRFNLNGNTNFTNITVEAKPDEVQLLIYILSTTPGNLFATLRNPADKIINTAKTVTLDDVLGKARLTMPLNPPPQVAPQPMPASVQQKKPVMNRPKNKNFQDL